MLRIGRFAMVVVGLGVSGLALAADPMGGSMDKQPMGMGDRDQTSMEHMDAASTIKSWPADAQKAANDLIQQNGQPAAVTDRMLVWYDKAPFKSVAVYRDGAQSDFPSSHKNVVEHVIAYQVPPEMLDDLAVFDPSLMVDRTAGTITVRSDSAAMNLLALNLADQIIRGQKTVADARVDFGQKALALQNGEQPDLTQKLAFQAKDGAGYRDRAIIQGGKVTSSGLQQSDLQKVDLEQKVDLQKTEQDLQKSQGKQQPGIQKSSEERVVPDRGIDESGRDLDRGLDDMNDLDENQDDMDKGTDENKSDDDLDQY